MADEEKEELGQYNTDSAQNEQQGIFGEYEELLAEYEHKERIRRLTGPAVSIAVHIVIFLLAALFIVPQPKEEEELKITSKKMEFKHVEKKLEKDLKELEEKANKVSPTVSKPDVEASEPTEDVSESNPLKKSMAGADSSMNTSGLTNVSPMESGLEVGGLYGGRTDAGRKKARKAHGGSREAEKAVLAALEWLKRTQKKDGSWGHYEGRKAGKPAAMTGLALLTYLAHGETPTNSEKFGRTVQKAMQWLAKWRMKHGVGHGYTDGINTYALCEAYNMTKLPFLKEAAKKGLRLMIEGQQERGGWNYGYKKGDRWDTSVTGWQVQALKAGYAAGIELPGMEQAMLDSIDFLKNISYKGGRYGYSSPGNGSWGMTGAGMLALELLGEQDSREVQVPAQLVSRHNPSWKMVERKKKKKGKEGKKAKTWPGRFPIYAWYYLTQGMFHAGKDYFEKWNNVYAPMIVDEQEEDGHWESIASGHSRGPWYATTLLALSLQVYYRYLPTYEVPTKLAKGDTSRDGKGDSESSGSDSGIGLGPGDGGIKIK